MKSLYLLVITLVISVVSCRTKDGAPGPAGDNTLTKQGSISGTITYTSNNSNVDVPFKYEYFESLSDNKFYYYDEDGDYYEIKVQRRDQKDSYNYCNFDLYGYGNNGIEDDPDYTSISFNFVTQINNQLVTFYGYNATITNVNLDHVTGRLTFDYTATVNSSNGSGTVTGKVDVILNRAPRNIFNWAQ